MPTIIRGRRRLIREASLSDRVVRMSGGRGWDPPEASIMVKMSTRRATAVAETIGDPAAKTQ